MTTCVNCQSRPATTTWVGEGGVLGYVHGLGMAWCQVCVLEAQIAHAEAAAVRLPLLRATLANIQEERAQLHGGFEDISTATMHVELHPLPPDVQRDIERNLRLGRAPDTIRHPEDNKP